MTSPKETLEWCELGDLEERTEVQFEMLLFHHFLSTHNTWKYLKLSLE